MNPDELFLLVQRLNGPMEALAALAAELQIHTEGMNAAPSILSALDNVVKALGIDPAELERLPAEQKRAVAGGIHAFMRQAVDVIEHPARTPGWSYTDTRFLQSQGRMSMPVAGVIATLAPSFGTLASRLRGDGARFLDVGTGVGWLAIAMANLFPGLHVVGLDVLPTALTVGRENVAAAGLGERIELRQGDVVELADRDAFDLAFIAGPFLPEALVPAALERVRDALKPGGVLLFGSFATIEDPVAEATQALRIVRSGGRPWNLADVRTLLEKAGLSETRVVERSWRAPVAFAAGIKA